MRGLEIDLQSCCNFIRSQGLLRFYVYLEKKKSPNSQTQNHLDLLDIFFFFLFKISGSTLLY